MEESREDFERLWQESIQLPAHKELSLKKVEVDISIDELMDRYILFSKQAVAQGQMKGELLERLIKQTDEFKKALIDVDNTIIHRLARDHVRRLFDRK